MQVIINIMVVISLVFLLGCVDSSQDNIDIRKNAVEQLYPEFKDFENQESFAGKQVKVETLDSDYYIAYLTLGSGVPIAKAACFKVDDAMDVTKIGEYPDVGVSGALATDIDPKTCRGI